MCRYRYIAAAMALILLLSAVATASAVKIDQQGDIYHTNLEGHHVILYCFNHAYAWPSDTAEYEIKPDYLADYPEVVKKVQRILFAGYPTNGMNFYTLEEVKPLTIADYNAMLAVPEWLPYYTVEQTGERPFAYLAEFLPQPLTYETVEQQLLGQNFLQDVLRLKDKSIKSKIKQTDFYKAMECRMFGNPLEKLAQMTADSADNIWGATQYALWTVLKEAEAEIEGKNPFEGNNTFDDVYVHPLSEKLIRFANANTPEILLAEPMEPIAVLGKAHFTQDEEGDWYSEPLTIRAPKDHHPVYRLKLPQNMECIGADPQNIMAEKSFVLKLKTQPPANLQLEITAQASWPSPLYLYQTEAVPTGLKTEYQKMAGVYVNSKMLRTSLPVSAAEPRPTPEPNPEEPPKPLPSNGPTSIPTGIPNVPKTGDSFQLELVVALLLISAFAIGCSGKKRKA